MEIILRIFQQTGWQVIGKIILSLSTIGIMAVVTRGYGREQTGVFTLALTYLSFFYLAADLGINALFIQKTARMDNQALEKEWQKLWGARIVLALGLSVTCIGGLFFLPFANKLFIWSVIAGAGAIFGSAGYVSANAFFQKELKYNLSILSSSIAGVLTLGMVLIFTLQGLPLPYLMVAHMLGWIVCGTISIILLSKFFGKVYPIIDWQYGYEVLRQYWSVSLTLVLNVVYFRVDAFLLTAMRSFSEAALYNVAYQVFQSALVLPTFIMNSYYPLMLNRLERGKVEFAKEYKKALVLMLLVSLGGVIATFLLSPIVISLAAGEGFAESGQVLNILALGFPAYFVSAVLMWFLVARKRYKVLLGIYGLGLIVNVGLNFWFIPYYSFTACAFITGISEYLILFAQAFILWKEFRRWS